MGVMTTDSHRLDGRFQPQIVIIMASMVIRVIPAILAIAIIDGAASSGSVRPNMAAPSKAQDTRGPQTIVEPR